MSPTGIARNWKDLIIRKYSEQSHWLWRYLFKLNNKLFSIIARFARVCCFFFLVYLQRRLLTLYVAGLLKAIFCTSKIIRLSVFAWITKFFRNKMNCRAEDTMLVNTRAPPFRSFESHLSNIIRLCFKIKEVLDIETVERCLVSEVCSCIRCLYCLVWRNGFSLENFKQCFFSSMDSVA